MTDREMLEQLFQRANIEYKVKPDKPNEIKVREGYTGVTGYSRFYAIFSFGDKGALEEIGVWE